MKKPFVFISYSTKDADSANLVHSYLEGNGVACWIASRNIEGGQSFAVQIVDAIEAKIGAMCDADALAVRAKLEELNSAFANMGDQFADMFQNIKPEDVSNAMVALEKGEMSEERLVREYMKQMGSKEKSDEQ